MTATLDPGILSSQLPLPLLVAGLSNLELGLLSFLALVIGLAGGIVGIALGVIRLPSMTLIGVDPLMAAGTNLAVTVLGAIAGSWPAILERRVVGRIALVMGAPAIGGSFVGARYADVVPTWVLLLMVALFLAWSGLLLVVRAAQELHNMHDSSFIPEHGGRGNLTRRTVARETGIGVVIGVIGGAAGVALGVLRMPAMLHILKMEPGLAAGTNLMVTVLVGTAGFAGHALGGRIDWPLLAVIGLVSMFGMYVGSRLTHRFDATKLRLFIGIVFLVMVPVMIWDVISRATQ